MSLIDYTEGPCPFASDGTCSGQDECSDPVRCTVDRAYNDLGPFIVDARYSVRRLRSE